jgi:Family of unknown function (DUF5686)/CarboxypepD_reg-like domain
MKQFLLFFFSCNIIFFTAQAGKISGTVTDDKGNILPFASILVKGTSKGTTTNNEGKYFLDLEPGKYTIISQYVGFTRHEKTITVANENIKLDFQLSLQQLSLQEVVVRPGGEDPAYEIIRHAIKKRKDYENPLDSFTCEAYIKTLIKTRHLPKKVFGKKIDSSDLKDMGVDSAGRGIIYLSENLTKVAYKKPNKIKLEVLSGRESGSNGFGFSFPTFINFYNNNVTILAEQLNPRGFISPISENAMNFYKYKFLGSFYEDGKEINKIRVIPRRKYEPCFSGTINIVDGEWRIHSLDLLLKKESQLEILDTLEIRQFQNPVNKNVWETKDQVVYFTFNIFGIDAIGNFLNVYNNYDTAPQFRKKYFNNVVVKFDTAVNKKTNAYWDSLRPVQLEPEELKNYKIKDSIYKSTIDSAGTKRNRDSLLKKQGHIKPMQILYNGFNRSNFDPKDPVEYSFQPLLSNVEYNTVEGLSLTLEGSIRKTFSKSNEQLSFSPHIRYGFSNTHLNAWATIGLNKRSFSFSDDGGSTNRQNWTLSGGKRISQFNKDNPISETLNGIYTLLFRDNYMKIYENYFTELNYARRWDNGLSIKVNGLYEDRLPINNTTNYSFFGSKNKMFTPNYPFEQLDSQFTRHQAFITSIDLEFRPGLRYIEFPDRKMAFGSKYPTFAFSYQHGWKNIFGSDVDFDKWSFSVWDNVNFKLKGQLDYRFSIGGFLNAKSVFIQDYQHFNGNQLIFASQYMNSFQLASYYANSTTANFYATGHLEHHFNGLLTNKIPLFRKLNWDLVAGSNAFYVNTNNNYVEVFGGLENIFKLLRVDFVASYLNGHYNQTGVRIGLGGILGNSVKVNRK